MHRAALRALAACASLVALSTSLAAAPLALDAHAYAPSVPAPEPAVAVSEPPPVQQVAQNNLGGGFIEFLFSNAAREQTQYPAQPQYQPPQPQYQAQPYSPPQPQPQYAVQPQYTPRSPLEALFGGQQQYPQYPRQPEQASYDPDPQERGYQDPYLQRPSQVPVAPRADGRFQMDPRYLKQVVSYKGGESAGTVIIDTPHKFLYLVQGNGTAIRYGVGVGRPGFTWAGVKQVSLKREWPDWTPPPEMLRRQPDLPRHMAGGPRNPLGARALYLGSSLYRIHGSNEPWTIGTNVSSGCIRMRNEDVIDLYERVKVGTRVVVI